ncbi:hypothetical protein [Paenibacillus paeoniae]|uniref:hypothetical protein n=1 Tax=Paenibacillus paeoniae TaxID=2292705 RepID=UPI001402D168|nr:hypothetical protein [Paenibacillus paeoniae]
MQVKLIISTDRNTKAACYNYLIEKYKKEKDRQIQNHDKLNSVDDKNKDANSFS